MTLSTGPVFFANWFAAPGISEVSWQWICPQKWPPGALCSCTFCCPLGAGHMAQPGTDQYQSRVSVRESTNNTGAAADLPVQPFSDIVGTDTDSVCTGEIAVSQCFLHASTFLAASFSFMECSLSTTVLALSRAALLLSRA